MSALPKPATPTVDAIYHHWAKTKNEPPRPYLGASIIGKPCERQLWYAFRWAAYEVFEGRMLRLFDRGHREEQVYMHEFKAIGVEALSIDDRTGNQFRVSAIGGHSGGGMDGVARGFIEAPKAWHVIEIKTHGQKSYDNLVKLGLYKAKFEHYAQILLYQKWFEIDRGYYFATNKNTDEIHAERVRYDAKAADALEAKAERVIKSANPPPRMNENPSWYECKFCPAHGICHMKKTPPPNCRTCVHSTPEMDGNARWSCARLKKDLSESEQRKGCPSHRYIPALIPYAKVTDADEAANWVEYTTPDGKVFINGEHGLKSYESVELQHMTAAAHGDELTESMRAEFGARMVEHHDAEPDMVQQHEIENSQQVDARA